MDSKRISHITGRLSQDEIDEVLECTHPDEWDELVETAFNFAAAGKITAGTALQLRRNVQFRRVLVNNVEMIPANKIDLDKLTEWLRADLIFAVEYGDRILVPAFQIDAANGGKPLPIVGRVLKILHAKKKRDWCIFGWWVRGNSWLGGFQPLRIMHNAPDSVLEAAEHTVGEIDY